MKLLTDIPPRSNGVVMLQGEQAYEFKYDPEHGALSCEVDDEQDLALALRSENFYPANQEDEARAMEIAGAPVGHIDADSDPDDLDDDMNAPPIEGKPAATKKAPAKKAASK